MMEAILNDRTPNFYFMHYELATWTMTNLLLIPSFAFPLSAIVKRNPLSATARRAGWVGCHIALNEFPRTREFMLSATDEPRLWMRCVRSSEGSNRLPKSRQRSAGGL